MCVCVCGGGGVGGGDGHLCACGEGCGGQEQGERGGLCGCTFRMVQPDKV